jgi:alkyldihydroxyacetonephosphate synthase
VAEPPSPSELRRALAGLVGEGRVSQSAADKDTYSRDMWPRLLFGVRAGQTAMHPPDAVVWPETEDEIAAIVHLCRRLGVPIVPYGAGSGVCGGAVPIHGGVTVDLKRLGRVIAIDPDALTVTAEAGINGERLERELAAVGLTLGHFPSSIYCSTLGGWLAARSAGQMSTKYGKVEDMVVSLRAVTGRGDVITTGGRGRASTGPDFTQLLVGSEGTLGLITQATLRVRPAPAARHLRGFEFSNVMTALEAIRRVLQRGLRPAVVRLYDEFDTLVHRRSGKPDGDDGGSAAPRPMGYPGPGEGALPSLAPAPGERAPGEGDAGLLAAVGQLLGGGGSGRLGEAVLRRALSRPKIMNAAAETLAARLGRRGCLLIVGVEGPRPRADVEAELVFAELGSAGGEDLGAGPGERWLAHRYAVSYNMSKVFHAGAFVDTMEVAATWERLPDLYDGVRRAISEHAFVMAHFSHAYSEGCSIYFSFVGYGSTRAQAEAKYDAIWRSGLAAASHAGGTISHHHGVGLLKAFAMADEHRESMAIYQAVKRAFDPDHIMNPGKMGLGRRPAPAGAARRDTPWSPTPTR